VTELKKIFVGAALASGLVFPTLSQTLSLTNGLQTVPALTNTTVTMTGRSELVVTAATNPLPGCVVNLNSPDAWLVLPYIRPSNFSTNYLSQVLVNGATAVAGGNCRLDQYAMGSVVVPQAPNFTPLTVFSAQNFLGGSAALGLYTYYTNNALGGLNDAISSFRLKRGYAATFAQNADGTGASRVFVAQDADLEVSVMPTNLDDQCSFVRVLPWRWTGKKGWVGGISTSTALIDPLWNYDYDNLATSTLDTEYVPMRDTAYWDAYANINSIQKATEVLGFNEPDQANQANMTVAAAIAQWPSLMQSGLRVGAPAVSSSGVSGQGLSWLYSFMSQATNLGYRVDYIPVHLYKCSWTTAQFSNYLAGVYQTTGKPVWVTEFNDTDFSSGCNQSQSSEASAIGGYISMMEACPFVERYSVYEYFDPSTSLNLVTTNSPPSVTPAGLVYHNQQSVMAYAQIPPPGGARSVAQFEFETNTLDSSGFGNNGLAFGVPSYVAGHTGQAVAMDGTNNYIQLPTTIGNSASFTFAAWVYWNGGASWQRIFDFGDDTSHYLFLTPSSGSGTLRFAINNGSGEQLIETSPLPAGQWRHVAITLSGSSAKLYTNGVLAASSSSFTIAPSNFNPNLNYLGKSQFPADPLFRGNLDEVEIADYAMTAAQIAALTTNLPPQFTTNLFARSTATQGVAYSDTIAGTATDPNPNNTTLTYSKAGGPAWLVVIANGTLSGTPPAGFGGTNNFTICVTDSAGATAFAVLTIYTIATTANGVWTADASGNWSDATKWSGSNVANAAGYTADFSTINITANRTVTLDTSRSIGNLKFSDTVGAQSWILNSTNGSILTLNMGSPAVPMISVTNSATLSAPLAGTNGFNKSGPGTLILSATNLLSGAARINLGILSLANSNALQNATLNLDGSDFGTVSFNAITAANLGGLSGVRNLALANNVSSPVALIVSNSAASAYAGILSGSGSLVKNGPGLLTLTSPQTYTGGTVVGGGTLKLARDPVVKLTFDSVSGSANGKIITNSGTGGSAMNGVIYTNNGTGASGASFVAGKVGNALSLAGDGTFIAISNRVTSLDGSTVGVNWTLALWLKTTNAGAGFAYQGDGGWGSSNTAFYLNQGNTTAGTHVGAVRYAGGWLTGNATVNDGNWHFIAIADSGGTKNIYVDGNLDITTTSWTYGSEGGLFWIGGTADGGDGVSPMNGLLDEVSIYNRALTQTEVRSLTNALPALTAGTFGGQLPSATALAISAGATFDLGGNSQVIGTLLDGNGGGTITNSGPAPVTLTLGGNSGTLTFSGSIADHSPTNAISLLKSGISAEIFAGTNTYSGPTTINAGTFLVNGQLGTNLITVNGGLFGGSGTLLGSLLIQSGGTVSPGGSGNIGVLTCNGNVTLTGTTAMEISAAPLTNDMLMVGGTLNYGGTLSPANLSGSLVGGQTFQLFSAANANGNFAGLAGSPGAGLDWQFNPVNGVLTIYSTVPTNLTASLVNDTLQISWPADHVGWQLMMNTNGLQNSSAWTLVPNSAATNQMWLPLDPTQTSVFFELVYP
jgi:autotransporter-associated beta strand protein